MMSWLRPSATIDADSPMIGDDEAVSSTRIPRVKIEPMQQQQQQQQQQFDPAPTATEEAAPTTAANTESNGEQHNNTSTSTGSVEEDEEGEEEAQEEEQKEKEKDEEDDDDEEAEQDDDDDDDDAMSDASSVSDGSTGALHSCWSAWSQISHTEIPDQSYSAYLKSAKLLPKTRQLIARCRDEAIIPVCEDPWPILLKGTTTMPATTETVKNQVKGTVDADTPMRTQEPQSYSDSSPSDHPAPNLLIDINNNTTSSSNPSNETTTTTPSYTVHRRLDHTNGRIEYKLLASRFIPDRQVIGFIGGQMLEAADAQAEGLHSTQQIRIDSGYLQQWYGYRGQNDLVLSTSRYGNILSRCMRDPSTLIPNPLVQRRRALRKRKEQEMMLMKEMKAKAKEKRERIRMEEEEKKRVKLEQRRAMLGIRVKIEGDVAERDATVVEEDTTINLNDTTANNDNLATDITTTSSSPQKRTRKSLFESSLMHPPVIVDPSASRQPRFAARLAKQKLRETGGRTRPSTIDMTQEIDTDLRMNDEDLVDHHPSQQTTSHHTNPPPSNRRDHADDEDDASSTSSASSNDLLPGAQSTTPALAIDHAHSRVSMEDHTVRTELYLDQRAAMFVLVVYASGDINEGTELKCYPHVPEFESRDHRSLFIQARQNHWHHRNVTLLEKTLSKHKLSWNIIPQEESESVGAGVAPTPLNQDEELRNLGSRKERYPVPLSSLKRADIFKRIDYAAALDASDCQNCPRPIFGSSVPQSIRDRIEQLQDFIPRTVRVHDEFVDTAAAQFMQQQLLAQQLNHSPSPAAGAVMTPPLTREVNVNYTDVKRLLGQSDLFNSNLIEVREVINILHPVRRYTPPWSRSFAVVAKAKIEPGTFLYAYSGVWEMKFEHGEGKATAERTIGGGGGGARASVKMETDEVMNVTREDVAMKSELAPTTTTTNTAIFQNPADTCPYCGLLFTSKTRYTHKPFCLKNPANKSAASRMQEQQTAKEKKGKRSGSRRGRSGVKKEEGVDDKSEVDSEHSGDEDDVNKKDKTSSEQPTAEEEEENPSSSAYLYSATLSQIQQQIPHFSLFSEHDRAALSSLPKHIRSQPQHDLSQTIEFVLDAEHHGNIGRFTNDIRWRESAAANVSKTSNGHLIHTDSQRNIDTCFCLHRGMMYICMYATRTIQPNSECMTDYGIEYWKVMDAQLMESHLRYRAYIKLYEKSLIEMCRSYGLPLPRKPHPVIESDVSHSYPIPTLQSANVKRAVGRPSTSTKRSDPDADGDSDVQEVDDPYSSTRLQPLEQPVPAKLRGHDYSHLYYRAKKKPYPQHVRDEPDESDWVVEKIVKKGQSKDGEILYEIKWYGYPSSANTWESISNLQNCLDMVARFNASTDALPTACKEWQYIQVRHDKNGQLLSSKSHIVRRTDLDGKEKGKRRKGRNRTRSISPPARTKAASRRTSIEVLPAPVPPKLVAKANEAVAKSAAEVDQRLKSRANAATTLAMTTTSSTKKKTGNGKGKKRARISTTRKTNKKVKVESSTSSKTHTNGADESSGADIDEDLSPRIAVSDSDNDNADHVAMSDSDGSISPYPLPLPPISSLVASTAGTGLPESQVSAIAHAVRTLWERQDAKMKQIQKQNAAAAAGSSSSSSSTRRSSAAHASSSSSAKKPAAAVTKTSTKKPATPKLAPKSAPAKKSKPAVVVVAKPKVSTPIKPTPTPRSSKVSSSSAVARTSTSSLSSSHHPHHASIYSSSSRLTSDLCKYCKFDFAHSTLAAKESHIEACQEERRKDNRQRTSL